MQPYGLSRKPWADGEAIARYPYREDYPGYQGTEYWSADCANGGALDLAPDDSTWP